MQKMTGQTADIAAENAAKIRELFPDCVDPQGNINFPALKTRLGVPVDSDKDSAANYSFVWSGKEKGRAYALAPSAGTLRPNRSKSVDFDTTKNLYIEGDNLEVLKLLRGAYAKRVKMIYIDPPYNTGNDFVYNDDYSDSIESYKKLVGLVANDGTKLKTNADTAGRYHTNWLNMMFPRLLLARDLLSDDGAIFISIDDHEVANLKKICDEVFGEPNFVAQFVWAAGRKNDSKHVSVSHEYILCYFKDAQYIADKKIVWRERKQGLDDIYSAYDSLRRQFGTDNEAVENGLKAWYRGLPDGHPAKDHDHYCNVDDNGIFFADNISWPGGGGPKYEVLHPVTKKPVTIPSRGWLYSDPKRMQEQIDAGRVLFGEDENSVPTLKAYLREREESVPYSVFYKDGRAASKRLKTLLGDKVFENPKDEEILKRLIEFSGTGENDIVMDFFSGSGTTAHALFLAEAEKTLSRRFILVQLQEVIDPDKISGEKAKKVARNAVAFLDSINAPHTICSIGEERIRRAAAKIKAEHPNFKGDLGFKVFTLDSSNVIPWNPDPSKLDLTMRDMEKNLVSGRKNEDLLFEILLKKNVPLDVDIESFEVETEENGAKTKNTVYVAGGVLFVCLDQHIPGEVSSEILKLRDELAPETDIQVVFRETGFCDVDKTNALAILEQGGVDGGQIWTL